MGSKVIKNVVFVVIVANLVIIAIVFSGANTPPARPLPNPNGYDDFVKAAQMVKGDVHNYEDMNRDELTALVATNTEALKLLRMGLTKECLQPRYYSIIGGSNHLQGLRALELGVLPSSEGRLAELDGRKEEAAKDYLDEIRFAQEYTRGAIMLDRIESVSVETVALRNLKLLTKDADAKLCREVASELQEIDAHEEPFENTVSNEREFTRNAYSISDKIWGLIHHRNIQQMHDEAVLAIKTNTQRRRQIILEFAARAYELEKGKPPQSAADLVPEYLKAVPKDPVTGKDLELGK